MKSTLSKNSCRLIVEALRSRANIIETGDHRLSAFDAVNARKSGLVKPLNDQQIETVQQLRRLAKKFDSSSEAVVHHPKVVQPAY